MSQKKRATTLRGNNGGQASRSRQSSKRPPGPDTIFGGLVANQRARLGLTQSQLAARMHISRSKVARIERGQAPDPETRRQLSHALYPDRGIGPVHRLAAQSPRGGSACPMAPAGVGVAWRPCWLC